MGETTPHEPTSRNPCPHCFPYSRCHSDCTWDGTGPTSYDIDYRSLVFTPTSPAYFPSSTPTSVGNTSAVYTPTSPAYVPSSTPTGVGNTIAVYTPPQFVTVPGYEVPTTSSDGQPINTIIYNQAVVWQRPGTEVVSQKPKQKKNMTYYRLGLVRSKRRSSKSFRQIVTEEKQLKEHAKAAVTARKAAKPARV
jgi:hypothetical protein